MRTDHLLFSQTHNYNAFDQSFVRKMNSCSCSSSSIASFSEPNLTMLSRHLRRNRRLNLNSPNGQNFENLVTRRRKRPRAASCCVHNSFKIQVLFIFHNNFGPFFAPLNIFPRRIYLCRSRDFPPLDHSPDKQQWSFQVASHVNHFDP